MLHLKGVSWMAIPWDLEPAVIVGCAVLAGLYVWGVGWRLKAVFFALGDVALLMALISPLDTLADHYLFSAHMVQHLILLEVVPPLFILSLPASLPLPGMVGRLEHWLRQPLRAWIIGFVTMAAWHIPVCYNAALANDGVHATEHLCFLISACIFWWPVLAPRRESRMPAISAVLYLFSRMAANLVLGMVIFAEPVVLYAGYSAAAARLGWGLTPLMDQRVGGVLMWAPTLLIDIAAAPLLLALFFNPAEERRGPMCEAAPSPDASAVPGD